MGFSTNFENPSYKEVKKPFTHRDFLEILAEFKKYPSIKIHSRHTVNHLVQRQSPEHKVDIDSCHDTELHETAIWTDEQNPRGTSVR